jgi:glycosyltransferase involved in cell wall biosynthesis
MRICFWGNFSASLTGNLGGGGELQIALLARAFAKLGHEVLVLDYDIAEKFQTVEGIKVYPVNGWNDGIKIIRTFTHRLPNLYLSLRDLNADIYYCRIRDYRHIFAWLAARRVKAKFILGIASDLDILNFKMRWKYFYINNLRKPYVYFDGILIEIIYPWLLRKSDYVFVQHSDQQKILLRKNVNSVVFPNLIDLNNIPVLSNPVRKDFIYVGWLDKRKGFIELFELIKRAPQYTFKVIGPTRDKEAYDIYEKLKSFPNVSLLGKLSHSETINHIANSIALISTSQMEGFPNIFIEAWACGIPVLSLYFDPGGVIKREQLGEVADGNIEKLLKNMSSVKNTDEFSKRAKTYVEHNHVLNSERLRELNSFANELLNKGKPGKKENNIYDYNT